MNIPQRTPARPPGIGVIGAGFHASTNLLPALRIASVPVRAVATRNATQAARAAAAIGPDVRSYGTATELLHDPEVDGVIISAQPRDQVALVEQAIRERRHVLAEKPLGLSSAEARRLARLADQFDVTLTAAFMKRHAPLYRQVADLLEGRRLGRVHSFQLTFACDSTAFAHTPAEFLLFAAIHVVDLTRWLFGEVSSVVAERTVDGPATTISATLLFGSGVVGSLQLTGLPSHDSEIERLLVSGDRGWLETDGARRLSVHDAPNSAASPGDLTTVTTEHTPSESTMSGGTADLLLRGFVGEMTHFAELLADPRSAAGAAWDNVRTMELCERILQASEPIPAGDTVVWELGAAGPVRDRFLTDILDGRKSGSTSLRIAYEHRAEPVPTVGSRRWVLDSNGLPAALIEYTAVFEGRLDEVPDDVARHDGADLARFIDDHLSYFASLSSDMRTYLGDPSWTPTPASNVVATTFRLVGVA
ncbi:Gfo/Idh/MocA family oxidoreductase [Plantibacter flavus]|uniref:Gfo/Idh/MocA family oxidoreductase n=1 Tax=Plantibacter flavus TaxID=150123 RepID=UPI003F16910B